MGIPAQVFTTRASMPYEVRVCGPAPGLVTGGDGLSYHVADGLDALTWADIVFIPGYRFPDREDPPQVVVDALIAAHERSARLAAISTGAFALAATGLLDGRRATTHWHYTRALAERHPAVRVDENVLFVDEGRVLTSAGAASGIDLCLHILRGDLGVATANHAARRLVAAPYRSGGQAQYVPRSVPEPLGERFAATREWALHRLDKPFTLETLARHAAVSPRTFSRRFAEDSGFTPMQWVLRARLDMAALARLLAFDSTAGRLGRTVTVDGDALVVDGRRITVLAQREPATLPWAELGVDIVLEATGRFTSAAAARAHLAAGAKKVLVGAPSEGADVTLAYGVNNDAYDPAAHTIISNASCTTNALAPLAAVLDELAGIEHGFMTTVHAYTQEQNLQDGPHRDARRARAAAVNITPTTTGAAKAIGKVLPQLDGKLSGDSIRVPVPVGSIVELNTTVARAVTRDEVLTAYRVAADGPLAGVLEYSDDPLVSSDIVGNPASSIFDSALTRVDGRHIKVVAWYDNEWGFSNRVIDTLELLAAHHQ